MEKKIEDFRAYCQVVGDTNVGCKRAANEDFLGMAETQNGLIATVCDGMGGHVGGATASHIAVNTILKVFNDKYFEDPRVGITEAIVSANNAILAHASEHPDLQGMGSTCVLLVVREGLVYVGHVGDSRIYLIRSHRIKQLTKDHSYVQMLVDAGQITKEQAEHHPRKNEITNALGIPEMQLPTVMDDAINPEAGDCFLLCSDGLSGMVSDDKIEKIVSRQKEMRAQERVNALIEEARENGGLDNITAQIVEFSITPNQVDPDSKPKNIKYALFAVISLFCILGVCYYLYSMHRGDKSDVVVEETTVDIHQENDSKVPSPEINNFNKDLGKIEIPVVNESINLMEIEFLENKTTIRTLGENQKTLFEEGIGFLQTETKKSENVKLLTSDSKIIVCLTKAISNDPIVKITLKNEIIIYELSLKVVQKKSIQQPKQSIQLPNRRQGAGKENSDSAKVATPSENPDDGQGEHGDNVGHSAKEQESGTSSYSQDSLNMDIKAV